MLLRDIIAAQQAKRAASIRAMQRQFAQREAIAHAEQQVRIERMRAYIHELARRDTERKAALRAKLLIATENIALTLDDVLALRPCRRIAAVKKLIGEWQGAITAQQALDAGCSIDDIAWVQSRLTRMRAIA